MNPEPVRVGIDARELLGEPTGVGRYLGELLRRWTAGADGSRRRFVLYAPEPLAMTLPPDVVERRVIGGGGGGTWWEQTSLRRAIAGDRLNAFFAPAYTAPLWAGVPLAVTIHDISFVAHPEWFRPLEGLRRRAVTRRTARAASVVLTVSAFSRAEIEQRLHVDADRIKIIPPGVNRAATLVEDTYRRDPIVLFVGSLFNRRRLPDLIAAFSRAAADLPMARLAIVGADRTWPRQDLRSLAVAEGIATRTQLLQYAPDAVVADLYRRAAVFVFLSEYEGFGLTPLEALAAGIPIVVADTPVAREVYGDAAMYVTVGDVGGAAAAIRELLVDRNKAAQGLARAAAVLSRYSWDEAASRTLEEIERIAVR